MYANSLTRAVLAAIALALPVSPAPHYTIGANGALTLDIAGAEARYGLIPTEVNGHRMLSVSLGATQGQGSLTLSVPSDRVPAKGRYPVASSWDQPGNQLPFHASFVAGSPERPRGWFHGESGTVTITDVTAGRISGQFEIRARGFLSADPDNENRWVTVWGTFEAHGDSTVTTVASVR
jgi:hypothetical protein